MYQVSESNVLFFILCIGLFVRLTDYEYMELSGNLCVFSERDEIISIVGWDYAVNFWLDDVLYPRKY